LNSGELTSIDLDEVLHAAGRWQARLSGLGDVQQPATREAVR
jgi:hypothetical protein